MYHSNLYVICDLDTLLAAETFKEQKRSIVIFGQTSERTANERLYYHLNNKKEKLIDGKHVMIVVKCWDDSEFTNSSLNGRIASTAGEYVLESIKQDFCQDVNFAPAGQKIKDIDAKAEELVKDKQFFESIVDSLRKTLSNPSFVDSNEKVGDFCKVLKWSLFSHTTVHSLIAIMLIKGSKICSVTWLWFIVLEKRKSQKLRPKIVEYAT